LEHGTGKSIVIVDLRRMGIGKNEVIKRQAKLEKKMDVHLEKHYISTPYGSSDSYALKLPGCLKLDILCDTKLRKSDCVLFGF
jgi:hypothetical protein